MLLFIVSFILIFASSYLLTSSLDKNSPKGFAYIFLIAFAQIVLSMEILSIPKQIKELPFISINAIFFIISLSIWKIFGSSLWQPKIKGFLNRLKNSLILDKSLVVLLLCWIYFVLISLFFIIVLPASTADGRIYHVTRSIIYVLNHSLAHFEASNIRSLVFPFNSEILYAWIILFTKKQMCLGIFSFLGYLLTCLSSYKIIRNLGFSMRKTLWVLLIFSSFASVIVTCVETETDLIISGLITLSIWLFLESLKSNSNKTLYMSSLAYAIAVGVKTTAILIIPACTVLFILFSIKNKNFKNFFKFLLFALVNFLIFSSFNYIQNFINYGDFLGTVGNNYLHKNRWGLRGTLASFLKYFKMFFDFSGTKLNEITVPALTTIFSKIFSIFNLQDVPDGNFSAPKFVYNSILIGIHTGCGILSFLLILPCWVSSLIAPVFLHRRKVYVLGFFGLTLLINLLTFSYLLAFMTFNIRFFTTLILISSPFLIYSYFKSNKNLLKWIYIFVTCFYLIFVTNNVFSRPLNTTLKEIKNSGIKQLRTDYSCVRYRPHTLKLYECKLNLALEEYFNKPEYKILFFNSETSEIMYNLVKNLQGHHYDLRNIENYKSIDFDKYDVIIVPTYGQQITGFKQYSPNRLEILDKNTEFTCYYIGPQNKILSKELLTGNSPVLYQLCRMNDYKFLKKHKDFTILGDINIYTILINKNTFTD